MNHDYSSLKILYATNTRTDYLVPGRLSPHQVVCGPMWPTRRDAEGRFLSLNTPFSYDLAELVASLPVAQRPDLVVVRTCAEMANAPRNLAAVPCPKVLLLADTHWQHNRRPVHTVLTYLQSERYDHAALLYDRHHAHWLREAGVESVHWLPGLEARAPAGAFAAERSPQVVFTGAARASQHPRRQRLLALVRERGLPLRRVAEMHIHSTAQFGESLITCHTSLNGELGVDVFEALGAGAFLLTDRLAPQSGLGQLFEDGRHLVCYDSPADLVEKIGHYLAHPEEALAIARQGQEHCLTQHAPARRAAELLDLAFRGTAPALDAGTERGAGTQLMERADLYDLFQMAQGENEEVHVLFHGISAPLADFADLPRLRLSLLAGSLAGAEPEALQRLGLAGRVALIDPEAAQARSWSALVVDLSRPGADPAALARRYPCMVLVPYGATPEGLETAAQALAGNGFRPGGNLPVLIRAATPRQPSWRWS